MAALPALDFQKTDPLDALKPWQPSAAEPWDRVRIAHLFRRAAFGATPEEIDTALADGFPKTLDRLLAGEPDAAERQEVLTEAGKVYTDPATLRAWWLYAMVEGGHPLREKLTLFWHNHFATSHAKVRSTARMFEQNVTLRKHALGKFRPFLLDMSRDTAMLVWLDSNRNVKGAPNENYAREVMELFSLGVGNYTEKDVQEAARAFTGWHHDAEQRTFENNPALHDAGEKTLLRQTGKWTGADVVRICCDQDACPRFLAGKLYAFLVSETRPPERLLAGLVAHLRKTDYDLAAFVRTVLSSRLFFSAHAYRARVKWPVEYAVGAVRAVTPGRVALADLLDPLAKMGQVLFAPPNVKGWRTGTDWLNSATLLARNNFAETVALGRLSRDPARRPRGPEPLAVVAKAALLAPDAAPPATPAPPAPAEEHDPVSVVYATKPRDVAAVVRRVGEVLYGEPLPAAAAARLEAFLKEPPGPDAPPRPDRNHIPRGGRGLGGGAVDVADGTTNTIVLGEDGAVVPGGRKLSTPELFGGEPVAVAPRPRVAANQPPAEAPPPRGVRPPPDLNSAEFKARVREALHAAMCLPEYQLN
jgi:hypothetical protein